MIEKLPRFVGHPDGVEITIPVGVSERPPSLMYAETYTVHIGYGEQLPADISGRAVPAWFRDSLLEQEDNWTLDAAETAKED